MKLTEEILGQIRANIAHAKKSEYYGKVLADVNPEDIRTEADFQKLPFSDKNDLRAAYPLGLAAVPNEDIARIHSSSGTTGTAVIIPYTQKDIDDWAIMFARCYEMAGVTRSDRVHITPGYGLWTAGIGFQLGAERLGAMTIPMGPGNTDKQIKMMVDLGSTVLTATSSYALLLAEEIDRRGIKDQIKLRKGLIGSERWGDKMRARIASELGVELYDIYGLTECYGPGIGISCSAENGMHMWTDYLYYEIVDPKTLKPVAEGESGELVVTTLQKEGAPLVRYRTHDLTREIPGECKCGSAFPRISTIIGRSDDMVKVKGTIIFPALVDGVLTAVDGVSSEYQIIIDHLNGRDIMRLFFETSIENSAQRKALEKEVAETFKSKVGSTPETHAVSLGELPRSEKKTTRIFDNRY
ncbi:MAG: phenylacetate--CoA ligase [Oscillospiraceae bacterium]|jgi:phenylacetate-CoA ligase|nr:phenylacetate--CoA ligase [Oscillospiraceae bacterium]